ncbi:hypothetical protein MZO42_05485 [Sphingomonas psychrotolerans]|uniref:Uncharacterized protein n=1 Tax=Sphingomonas psychrotolerans TaxID=1327635 RepID=A0ABU3N0S7_9SPHN|nr:hypothetical protein [Sphingomonas psychrotolerans]MDT8758144.1 hypothetical protein [Sphingomonas psychrotolerans]
MPNLWRIFPTLGKQYLVAERQMNGINGGFLRFPQIGTRSALMLASSTTSQSKHKVQETRS